MADHLTEKINVPLRFNIVELLCLSVLVALICSTKPCYILFPVHLWLFTCVSIQWQIIQTQKCILPWLHQLALVTLCYLLSSGPRLCINSVEYNSTKQTGSSKSRHAWAQKCASHEHLIITISNSPEAGWQFKHPHYLSVHLTIVFHWFTSLKVTAAAIHLAYSQPASNILYLTLTWVSHEHASYHHLVWNCFTIFSASLKGAWLQNC